MKYRVYIETSVVSYLTAKPSRDLIVAAHQESTRIWWEESKNHFQIFISQLVRDEAEKGNDGAAKKRLELINSIPSLPIDDNIVRLATLLVTHKGIPKSSIDDALHISYATIHKMDFLLTWNFKHIANAVMKSKLERIVNEAGYKLPVLCSPLELIGG